LMAPLVELTKAYESARRDGRFRAELATLLRDYAGRPTPLYFARHLSEHVGGARIYLKREDLCHTGAHKINNVLGQGLLAARMKIGRLPDAFSACVGGGSNAIGLFHPFIGDRRVRIIGVEAGGHGVASGQHGASLSAGRVGVLHGCMTYLLQSDDGQIATAHSISAGLDYPGVGPEHAYYKDSGRFEFVSITDEEALEGFQALARLEGIMPALESAHAVAYAVQLAKTLPRTKAIVVGLSGRGDKDVQVVAKSLGMGLG